MTVERSTDPVATALPIRVLLVDDHRIFRESLRALLEVHDGVAVVGEGEDGQQAVRLARELRPDIVVLDVQMPGQSALTTIADLRSASSRTKVVVLTMHDSMALARQLLQAGASTYLPKTIGHHELVAAIRSPVAGAPDTIALAMPRQSLESVGSPSSAMLTVREVEVMNLVARAHSNLAVAKALHLSESTVKRHLANIYRKIGATSRLDATRLVTRAGLITEDFAG